MGAKSWYSIKALADGSDGPAEVLIYDEIGLFGVTAADFVRDMATVDASEVTVRINSPGGSVFDGIAILNSLRGHDATVTTVVDGIAASIASVIAMGGDRVVMNKNATMMVHNAWDVVVGNADELAQAADRLRGFSANIASIYADKAGGTVADWQAIMDAETWYNADEAVAAGLADEAIVETVKLPSYARASLEKYKYAGREAAPAPHIVPRAKTPQPQVEAEVTQGKEPPVATLTESLVEKLGLDAEADDETILAAVEAKFAAPAEPAPPAEPTGEQITAAAAKLDMVMVPKAQYAETVAAVQELQNVRAAQVAADNERFLDDAIKAGKIGPANKVALMPLMKLDPSGTRAIVEAIPANVIPVAEMGHGQGSEEDHLDVGLAHAFAQITGRDFGKEN